MVAHQSNNDECYRDGSSDGSSESSDNPTDSVAEYGSPTATVVPMPYAIILVQDTAAQASKGDGGGRGIAQCRSHHAAGHVVWGRGKGGHAGHGVHHEGGRPMGHSNFNTTETERIGNIFPFLGRSGNLWPNAT